MANKVKLIDIQPKKELGENRDMGCHIGLSLSNSMFRQSSLVVILNWINDNFTECVLIVADSLYRHNNQIFHCDSEDEALVLAKKEGDVVFQIIENSLSRLDKCRFRLYRWENLFNLITTQSKIHFFETLCLQNTKFRNQITQTAEEFLIRQEKKGLKSRVSYEAAIEFSRRYLIEETAYMAEMIESGFPISIYPGTQLQVFKDFANGKYPDVKTPLSKGIYVDVTVKKV